MEEKGNNKGYQSKSVDLPQRGRGDRKKVEGKEGLVLISTNVFEVPLSNCGTRKSIRAKVLRLCRGKFNTTGGFATCARKILARDGPIRK